MDKVTVIQADRAAAAANIKRRLVWQHGGEQPWMDAGTMSMRMGEQDDHDEVQAFAAHRLATPAPDSEKLREARILIAAKALAAKQIDGVNERVGLSLMNMSKDLRDAMIERDYAGWIDDATYVVDALGATS